MFLVNGMRATLRQFNRLPNNNVYDDQNFQDVLIKCCPYDIAQGVKFGIYTVPEATGYYQVNRFVDVREGDQIIFESPNSDPTFESQVHTILKVQDEWLFNRIENKILAVK